MCTILIPLQRQRTHISTKKPAGLTPCDALSGEPVLCDLCAPRLDLTSLQSYALAVGSSLCGMVFVVGENCSLLGLAGFGFPWLNLNVSRNVRGAGLIVGLAFCSKLGEEVYRVAYVIRAPCLWLFVQAEKSNPVSSSLQALSQWESSGIWPRGKHGSVGFCGVAFQIIKKMRKASYQFASNLGFPTRWPLQKTHFPAHPKQN